MDYVVEAITRVPSQALQKSASSFGEEAAKILGSIIEESVKSATDDVTHTIQSSTDQVCKTIKSSVVDFGIKFKDTVLDSFTEWGYSIERSFTGAGNRMENGLVNAGTKLATLLDDSLTTNTLQLTHTIEKVSKETNANLSQLGIEQMKSFKQIYQREIHYFIYGWMIMCFSVLLLTIRFDVVFSMTSVYLMFVLFCFYEFKSVSTSLYLLISCVGFMVGHFSKEVPMIGSLPSVAILIVFLVLMLGIGYVVQNGFFQQWMDHLKEFQEFRNQKIQAEAEKKKE
jgi:hypothetical protein